MTYQNNYSSQGLSVPLSLQQTIEYLRYGNQRYFEQMILNVLKMAGPNIRKFSDYQQIIDRHDSMQRYRKRVLNGKQRSVKQKSKRRF